MAQRIAVIGGGLFGCTAAILAARAGHDVHLYEAKSDLMCGATAATYSRIHRGYHYPRSPETGRESRRAEKSFRAEYGAAVIDGGRQFYVVPPHNNRVTLAQFRQFLDNEDLPFAEDGGVFEVTEPRINLGVLCQMVRQMVRSAGVNVYTEAAYTPSHLRREFDRIVVATYAGLNDVLEGFGVPRQAYKYQVVERPVVRLPAGFKDVSIVVVDGPYGCIDPLDEGGLHILGHVVHTIHAEHTGCYPVIPGRLLDLLDKGTILKPRCSNFARVVEDLAKYVPGVREAEYMGSSFVLRAVLAHQESTDRRPTLVTQHDEQLLSIFSGKLGTAVRAGQGVLAMIDEREMVAA